MPRSFYFVGFELLYQLVSSNNEAMNVGLVMTV